MMRIIRWLQGYLCISLRGKQINRFLNLCSGNHIGLWNITRDIEHFIHVHIHLRDFYHIKPFLRKTKTKLRVVGRYGFPFWCYRHKYLKWFPVFVMLLICILLYGSTFVWTINIQGNTMISDQEIIEFLEKQDVTVGKKINEINFPQLEYSIRQSFAQMAWVTIYMERNNLCVEIRESLYDVYDDMQSSSGRYDLIANKDAYIYSIITRSGSAVVKDGMYVKKGDVLVKGICKIYDDFGTVKEELKLRADAKILADVDYTFLAPLTEIEIVALKIAGLYSDEMLNYIGNIKFSQFIEKLEENGVIILNKHVMIEKKEKAIYYRGFIHAREEIGMNVPVEDLEVNEFE